MYSDFTDPEILNFDSCQDRCKSGIKWWEYRKWNARSEPDSGKWDPMWLFRMYDSGKNAQILQQDGIYSVKNIY